MCFLMKNVVEQLLARFKTGGNQGMFLILPLCTIPAFLIRKSDVTPVTCTSEVLRKYIKYWIGQSGSLEMYHILMAGQPTPP